jgi:signal transduction histidine kinase
MQERAMKFGGTFSVASTPGGGTVVQVAAALQTEAVV